MSFAERIAAGVQQEDLIAKKLESLNQPTEKGRELHQSLLGILQTHMVTDHRFPSDTKDTSDINPASKLIALTAFTPKCIFPTELGIDVGFFIMAADYSLVESGQSKGSLRWGGEIDTFPKDSHLSLCVIDRESSFTKILTVGPTGSITTEGLLRKHPPDEAAFGDIGKTLEEMKTQLGEPDLSAKKDRIGQVSRLVETWHKFLVQASA